MKVLKLTIKKKFFDEIKSGKKKFEYREHKPYWINRITGKPYDVIEFRNGYRQDSPKLLVEYLGYQIISGYETPLGKMLQFKLLLGKIIEE